MKKREGGPWQAPDERALHNPPKAAPRRPASPVHPPLRQFVHPSFCTNSVYTHRHLYTKFYKTLYKLTVFYERRSSLPKALYIRLHRQAIRDQQASNPGHPSSRRENPQLGRHLSPAPVTPGSSRSPTRQATNSARLAGTLADPQLTSRDCH
jgi:hypothetical protein